MEYSKISATYRRCVLCGYPNMINIRRIPCPYCGKDSPPGPCVKSGRIGTILPSGEMIAI